MKTYLLSMLLILLFFLSACTGQNMPGSTVNIAANTPVLESTVAVTRPLESTRTLLQTETGTPVPAKNESSNLLATPNATSTGNPEIAQLIGLPVDPLPDGMKNLGTNILYTSDGMFLMLVQADNELLLLLSDSQKQVKDGLILPQLGENEIISSTYCTSNGVDDPFIITISRIDLEVMKTYFIPDENMLQAWRIDPDTGQFTDTVTDGIECSTKGGMDPNHVIVRFLQR